ncbi:MAG: hypothetical protein NTV01_12785 [Bacteroidia bacterium]|nr:hypothetical protein [Bacteroidia bacterium]
MSGIRYQVSGIGYRVSGIGVQVSGLGVVIVVGCRLCEGDWEFAVLFSIVPDVALTKVLIFMLPPATDTRYPIPDP